MKPWILWSWLWSDINPSIHTATRISTLYIWVNGWVNGWVNDWVNGCVKSWVNEWVNGCVKSWVNDWVNNWVLTAETQTPLFAGQTAPVSPVPHTHTLTHTHRHSDLLPSLEWLECSASGNNTVTDIKTDLDDEVLQALFWSVSVRTKVLSGWPVMVPQSPPVTTCWSTTVTVRQGQWTRPVDSASYSKTGAGSRNNNNHHVII